jgi:hypothetical protein
MRTTRIITVPLAAVLGAAALAGPAAAVPATRDTSTPSHADASALQGSRADGSGMRSPDATDPVTANVSVAPAEPTNPQPIGQPTPAVTVRSAGFDWGSAGIGAAAGIGAFAIALAGTAGMRRRRPPPSRSVATH